VLARHDQRLLFASLWAAERHLGEAAGRRRGGAQGLRIRTFDVTATETFRGLGAAPALISFADALPRLRAGELDAVLSSGDGGAGARLWEILPHFTEINYAMPLSFATIGSAAWTPSARPPPSAARREPKRPARPRRGNGRRYRAASPSTTSACVPTASPSPIRSTRRWRRGCARRERWR